jgi:hypothetical protein
MATTSEEMETLSTVLEELRLDKHDNEFRMYKEGFGTGNGKYYQPQDLAIVRTYRFEGDSNPSDSSILYLIEANDGLIGYSIDAYGAYSNHANDGYAEFIKNILVQDRNNTD